MNSKDISKLSYKELQALALQYRVPGNIKKKLLVKVIQAAKVGNGNEVGRLLQDFKQNRKRKVRKVKIKKLGLTSTPLHNSDYVMTDDYYCSQQQQPPCQWVGAEEEIANKDDDSRITQYEEFKQFLLKRMQRENFHPYDANNNDINNSTVVYVRTPSVSSEQKDPFENSTHTARSHVIAVNDTESFVYQSNENVEYQTLGDANGNVQGPILLKKMLQAPVGANLGEIASPVFGNYRFWTMEQDQTSNNILDDSDTLSAVSDVGDNEENLENNAEYYGFFNSVKGEYFLNEPTLVKNAAFEKIGQLSTVLTNENANQCKYYTASNDMNQEYETWTVANVMASTDNGSTSDFQPKMFQSMYCDNVGSDALHTPVNEDNLSCQYKVTEVADSYNASQNILTLHPSEDGQYYERNLIPTVLPDCHSTYYVPDAETNAEYVQGTHSNVNGNQNSAAPQTFTNYNQYSSDLSYEYAYSQSNPKSVPPSGNPVNQFDKNCNAVQVVQEHDNQRNVPDASEKAQTTNNVLDAFWPSKLSTNPYLENTLNLISNKRIDLAKVDQTSCVYCYIAPVVTHTSVPSNSTCSQKEKFVAEYRQHSFSPDWLLYNDTSCGLRMANLQAKIQEESPRVTDAQMSTSNSDLRESAEGSTSMPEVWTQDYEEKDANVGEDSGATVTDCLFSVINSDPLVSRATDLSKNQTE